jgi:hypothetical protein
VRSSRQIQRRCTEDLAFRVLAGNQAPDHVTIARFRVRHQQALAGFLVQSLKLCAAAGLVRLAVVALDGTRWPPTPPPPPATPSTGSSVRSPRSSGRPPRPTSATTASTAQTRGDQLPEALASKASRLARLRQAKALLEAEAAERQRRYEQRVAELAAAARAKGKQPRAHIRPRRRAEAPNPKATANTTDPDSRFMHTWRGSVQGYNAQAVTTLEQVIVAAELTQQANDLQQLDPMLAATTATLAAAGIPGRPGRVLADSGYWSIANLTQLPDAPELLIPPARHGRQGKPRKDGKPTASRSDGLRAAMTAKLASEDGRAWYAKRQQTIEPVFDQIKEQQGARRFLRRGLAVCDRASRWVRIRAANTAPTCQGTHGGRGEGLECCDAVRGIRNGRIPGADMADALCPYCKGQIAPPGAVRCGACGRDLVGAGGQRMVVTRRDTSVGAAPQPESFPEAGECVGCDASFIEVRDGQVVAYSLVSCDEKFCWYEGTAGGVV